MSEVLKFDIKFIIILILGAILFFDKCQDNKIEEGTINVNGQKLKLLKYTIDTFEVYKTSYGYKKGDDIHHETFHLDTAFLHEKIDTLSILRDYFSKNIYRDTLRLNDSLGFVYILDTISKNKIHSRTWMANVRERTIRETTITKELAKKEIYLGLNANFDKVDYLNSFGTSFILKNEKNNMYQLNFGLANKQPLNSSTQFTPYFGGGIYWKIK